MATAPNLLADLPAKLPEELFHNLFTTGNLRIERIVSFGHASPEGFWYDQPQGEWVLLLCGAARFHFEGEEPIDLTPGSYVNITAHCKHRVDWTDPNQPTVWLAVHYDGV